MLIYAFKALLILNVTDARGDMLQYLLIGIMLFKELWVYFECVKRAESKMRKERFHSKMNMGL